LNFEIYSRIFSIRWRYDTIV